MRLPERICRQNVSINLKEIFFMNSRLTIPRLCVLTTALFVLSGDVLAINSGNELFQLAQYEQLPHDQRREMRRQMREHWQQMPQEQRQDRRERYRDERRERHDAFQQMPSEDRRRMRDELRGRRDNGDGFGRGHAPDNRGRR
jgi:hypothetical protein